MKLKVNRNYLCGRCRHGYFSWVFCDKVVGLTGPIKKCTFFDPYFKETGNKKDDNKQ